ncbi:MAG: polysaccharide deacetylase family protein [Candidatus Brocadiia bacterium]
MGEVLATRLLDEVDAAVRVPEGLRLAAITCDVEPDYGNRVGSAELLENGRHLDALAVRCRELEVPLSVFVVTGYLGRCPDLARVIAERGPDAHAHSHAHEMARYRERSASEIRCSQEAFAGCFGRPALGYRAPQGLVVPGDSAALAASGYAFSASVFPARRRGVFDYRALPQVPWRWRSGVVELPFASTLGRRRMLTLSYLKLLGTLYWRRALRPERLPPVLVIDSHLHDYFVPRAYGRLPLAFRLAYRRNKHRGLALLAWLVARLRELGYQFFSMTELYHRVAGL